MTSGTIRKKSIFYTTCRRFGIAYNAALQAATAALAASGYRAARDSHHYRIIQSLAYTLECGPDLLEQFDGFRKKRNVGGYGRAGTVSDMEAKEMINLAKRLRGNVEVWLRKNHPELLEQ